jgi:hypothetical protein
MRIEHRRQNLITFILITFIVLPSIGCKQTMPEKPAEKAVPGDDLQAVLDSGKDLVLQKGAVYEIKNTLQYKFPNQKITTKDAIYISDYARLRIGDPNLMRLIDGARLAGIVLQHVILDGNRYRHSIVPKTGITGGGGQPPMVVFGGRGADGQKALNNVFMSTRTWSTLKVNGGASNILIEGNIFLGAGVGPRGNGREKAEVPFNWGDAVSCAAKNTIVRNNLIIDPTDVGIVFYGAPGSIAENNVISCISRESLGGINLVDGFLYPLNEDKKNPRYDYRGTIVRNNYIDAFGSRIHIAIPMGPGVWAPKHRHKTLVGATVHGNTIAGGAAAYGLIAGRVDSFSVYDNKSIAKYSGRGEGLNRKLPPDEPGPFIYDPKLTTNCKLQKEFQPSQRHLLHLLRCNHGKTNELGYRIYQYGKHEVRAVINAAYLEMLGRKPSQKEMEETIAWLQQTQSTADQLRRNLMKTNEFTERFGNIDPDDLHPYRISLWMNTLDKIQRDHMKKCKKMPDAKELYLTALSRLNR